MLERGQHGHGAVEDLLRALNGALRVVQLYPRGHRSVAAGLARAENALSTLLRNRSRIEIGILEDELIFEDRAIYQASQFAGFLIQVLKGHGVDRLTFLPGCHEKDLGELIDVLQQPPDVVSDMGGVHKVMRTRGVKTLVLERLMVSLLKPKERHGLIPPGLPGAKALPHSLIVQAKAGLDEVADSVASKKPIMIGPAKAYVYELTQALVEGESPLLSLAMLESHQDRWLKQLVKVSTLAVAFARRMGFDQKSMESMGTASFLHDIGLLSSGEDRAAVLKDEEGFRQHPVEGMRLLLSGKDVDKLSVVVAFEHHMGHDLSGFPKVVGKKRVHPVAELVGLAASFVDLVSPSEGREALRSDKAILELSKGMGQKFDDRLFACFVAMTGVFAPGILVQLNDGRIGLISAVNPLHALRPTVKLIMGSDGRELKKSVNIDLSKISSELMIMESVDAEVAGLDPDMLGRLRGNG